jgi:hypothetical protein
MEVSMEEEKKNERRRSKNQKKEVMSFKEQTKFFVDLSSEQEQLGLIFDLLKKCNDKTYGREIIFKDLAVYAIAKLSEKDVEKIQEASLSEMEKVRRLLDEHNKKTGASLSLGEFLVKKLNIN